jgi:hypothetical protein
MVGARGGRASLPPFDGPAPPAVSPTRSPFPRTSVSPNHPSGRTSRRVVCHIHRSNPGAVPIGREPGPSGAGRSGAAAPGAPNPGVEAACGRGISRPTAAVPPRVRRLYGQCRRVGPPAAFSLLVAGNRPHPATRTRLSSYRRATPASARNASGGQTRSRAPGVRLPRPPQGVRLPPSRLVCSPKRLGASDKPAALYRWTHFHRQ